MNSVWDCSRVPLCFHVAVCAFIGWTVLLCRVALRRVLLAFAAAYSTSLSSCRRFTWFSYGRRHKTSLLLWTMTWIIHGQHCSRCFVPFYILTYKSKRLDHNLLIHRPIWNNNLNHVLMFVKSHFCCKLYDILPALAYLSGNLLWRH